MKTRRITLLLLVVLTALMILQGWSVGVGKMFPGQSPITINFEYKGGGEEVSKVQEYTYSKEEVSSLAIDNQYGEVVVRGISGDVIRVTAEIIITAENEEEGKQLLQEFAIKENLSGNRLSYELEKPSADQPIDKPTRWVAVNYQVEVPEGLELSIRQRYGVMNVSQLRAALLKYEVQFATTTVQDFEGQLQGTSGFSTVNLRNVVGPVQLQDNYSTLNLSLKDVPEGYNFQIDQNYGSLRDSLNLQREESQNKLLATGSYGLGKYLVQVQANFSTINLKME